MTEPAQSGYYNSPWPGEDSCPERLQVPRSPVGLNLQPGEKLRCVTRNAFMCTMTVLRDPGEVYFLSHSALRNRLLRLPTTSCVERIDPLTLKPIKRSKRLPAGPMWPGGMAVHRNGDLYVVFGRYCHRLDPDCELVRSHELPVNKPYNSFVILDNGVIATKDISDNANSRLSFLDPETLQPVCEAFECPEPSIARLSSTGNTVYVVGVRSIFRVHLDEAMVPQLDDAWRFDYIGDTGQTYGWDVVLDGRDAWFMDNGKHTYFTKMIGAGVNQTPLNLVRVSMHDAANHAIVPISGINGGSITNPPLYDAVRQIVIAFDSANSHLQAWRYRDGELTLLWNKPHFGAASHMILFDETGELVINDFQPNKESVVVLDIETGRERGRVLTGGPTQGVLFPSPGWNRDFYWSTPSRLARVFVD